VRPRLEARPSYLCRKSARESFGRHPEKYGALLEHGAGIAPGPAAGVAIMLVGCSVIMVVGMASVAVVGWAAGGARGVAMVDCW
jgi:hypothetical protein